MREQAHYNNATDLMTIHQAILIELPIAGAKWSWGVGKEQEVAQAAWKGYDAWVRLTSASIDALYKNPLFVEMAARSIERGLRWRRLSQAFTGAFFARLWSSVGLPTAVTVQALTEESQSLAARLKTQEVQIQALREELRSSIVNPSTQRKKQAPHAGLDASRKAAPLKMNGRRLIPFPL